MENMKDFEKEIEQSFENIDQYNDQDFSKWEKFEKDRQDKVVYKIKVSEVVKSGVITYIDEIRAFIPASQLSTKYVENLEDYAGKSMDVIIITADAKNKKLVLSHRALEEEAIKNEKEEKFNSLQIGDVFDAKVESIKDYGVFVVLENGLSGLIHISQISNKRIKNPKSALKLGDIVKVKLIGKDNSKLSFSKKALEEQPFVDKKEEKVFNYKEKDRATTSMADLLKDFKF